MKRTAILLSLFLLSLTKMHAETSIYDIPLVDIDGNETSLEEYKGKVLLIVNVASKCGYTRQYKGLEELHDEYKDRGLVVLGFPCNQFGGQEPGTEAEIKEFCSLTFGVTFPMFSKVEVNGPDRHPLYVELAGDDSAFPGKIGWNFNKFLVDPEGKLVARFGSSVAPTSDKLLAAVEKVLPGS